MSHSVLVIDPSFLAREGYRHIFEATGEITCVGMANGPEEALQLFADSSPDVVITEIMFDRQLVAEFISRLKTLQENLPVLVVSMLENTRAVTQALEAGADGYLIKWEAAADLLPALRRVGAGEAVLSPSLDRPEIRKHFPG